VLLLNEYWMVVFVVTVLAVTLIGPLRVKLAGLTVSGAHTKANAQAPVEPQVQFV
jgi:hypothetical protein